jgi:WD40 repeat protein
LISSSHSELEYNFGEKDKFLYHENLQAEITKHKRYFTMDYLRAKKGDRPLKDRIQTPADNYQKLSQKIKETEPIRVARQKQRSDLQGFNLELEHLYGFRAYDLREGVLMTSSRRIFYTVGSAIVGIEPWSDNPKKQHIFNHHMTAVSCFDMFEDDDDVKMIASSEMSAENNILIWDPDTLEVKASVKKLFECGVSKIKFSNNGKFIAVIGVSEDSSQQLIVLSFPKIETFVKSGRRDDKIQAIAKIPSGPVLDLVFDSQDHAVYFLVGTQLYTFPFMTSKEIQAYSWASHNPVLLTCINYKKGRSILTSGINGFIYTWDGNH